MWLKTQVIQEQILGEEKKKTLNIEMGNNKAQLLTTVHLHRVKYVNNEMNKHQQQNTEFCFLPIFEIVEHFQF